MRKIKMVLALLPALLSAGCYTDKDDGRYASSCDNPSCNINLNVSSKNSIDVWSYKNSNSSSVNLNISIHTTSDKEITVIYTNEGNSYVTMPYISVNTALEDEMIYPHKKMEEFFEPAGSDVLRYLEPDIIDWNDSLDFGQTLSISDTRTWISHQNYGATSRTATLRKQLSVNGRTINLWIEDSEYANGNMDVKKIDSISSNISTIYTNVVSVAGEPWGPHIFYGLIPENQPLDIVFINFGNSGYAGYFWINNNYINKDNSNKALVIFVTTRSSAASTLSTIAHELTHAINFYQRFIVTKDFNMYEYEAFDFLDEMMAVMMEDIVADKISYNSAANRYMNWLNTPLYQYDFANWQGGDSYSVVSSFGSFLLRQYGIDFYKTLLGTLGTSIDVIDKAIKVYDNDGLAKALRNWGASIAMFPAVTAPEGFGYPERLNDNGFNLEAFDGSAYGKYRKLPTSSPATLAPHAHFPFLRKTTNNTYNESFVVPNGVGVSIVVK
jgi:hypothetical protein